MQTTEENKKKRPRTNRNRQKNIDKSTQSQPTTRYESDSMERLRPTASQLQPHAQPSSNPTQSSGQLVGRRTGIDPQHTSPAQPTASQARVQPQLSVSPKFNQHQQPSSAPENTIGLTSAAQAPMAQLPVQIPSPPPFSSVKFTTIGQQPELLRRFSDLAPSNDFGSESRFFHDDYQSASPEPPTSMSVKASGIGLGRPSLLQALGGSEVDVDANMDINPSLFTSSSDDPAAYRNGTTKSSQPRHPHHSSASDRKSSNDNKSNGKGHAAISVNTNFSTNTNADNSISTGNDGGGNAHSTSQQDSLAPTPDLLYPSSSGPANIVSNNDAIVPNTHTILAKLSAALAPGPGPSSIAASSSSGTGSMPNLLALRNLLAEKTAGLKARADRERERDTRIENEKDSAYNTESGLRSNGSGQDIHTQEQRFSSDTHPESNVHAEPNSDTYSNQRNAASEFSTTQDQQRHTQSPQLDVSSQARLTAGQTHNGTSPRSHTSPAPNTIAGDNTAATPFAQPEVPSFPTNTLPQVPHDALDSALSTAKQWFDDMTRARSEIQALLTRATVAESAVQTLRSELALSRSESASLREQVSSSSALLAQVQSSKLQLQTRARALEVEIEGLRAREVEERKERDLTRQEVDEAVRIGKEIVEWVDGRDKERKDEQEQQQGQEKEAKAGGNEDGLILQAETETETEKVLAHLEKEQEKSQLETQRQLQSEQEQHRQREQEEADAAEFNKKRAEVMKEKERATQETALRIRTARQGRPISGGVMLSTPATSTANVVQANSGNNTGGDVRTSGEDVPPVSVPIPSSVPKLESQATPAPHAQQVKEEEDVEVKMEELEATALAVPSDVHVNDPPARREPSLPSIVQPEVSSETQLPLSKRSSSHNQNGTQIPVSSESLPPRPSGPLPPVIPAHGPVAQKATPMSSQTSSSSGLSSAPKPKPISSKTRDAALDTSSEKIVSRARQQPLSGSRLRPPTNLATAAPSDDGGWNDMRSHTRAPTPERVNNSPITAAAQGYERYQRPYPPPLYSPPPVRQLTPPPAMLYRRVSDHYSPPPPSANHPSYAQRDSPPWSPPSPGPSARVPWSRKRPRATLDSYAPDEEPPAWRPWQGNGDRGPERPPATYAHADNAPTGPRTPPRSASWERAPHAEPQLQYNYKNRPRSPPPVFQGGRTARIGSGQSYRPANDSLPQQSYEAPPPRNVRPDDPEDQTWERQNAAHISETHTLNPGLSSRMDANYPQGPFESIQTHSPQQQESPNLTLLDRMSDKQRPLPSGPSSQSQGHSQFQSSGNNNHHRRISNQSRGSTQRGQFRGVRQPRGRGGGRGGSAESSNSERQSLAARISGARTSGSSTLQDRLS